MRRTAFVTALALFLVVAVSTPAVAQQTDLAAERSSLDTLCRAGDALQCYYLGESYLQGGDQADPGKAAVAYTRSCALLSGFRIACEKADLFANTAAEQVKCDSGDGKGRACFEHAAGRALIAQ
jgi:hypothetical protein